MQIFFFISSVGFVVLAVLISLVLIYFISILHSFSRILKVVEKDISSIGDTTKDMLEDVRDSTVFRLLFGKKKKKTKKV